MYNGEEFLNARSIRRSEKSGDARTEVSHLSREWASRSNPRIDYAQGNGRQETGKIREAPPLYSRRTGIRRDVACKRKYERNTDQADSPLTLIGFFDKYFTVIICVLCAAYTFFQIGFEIAKRMQ